MVLTAVVMALPVKVWALVTMNRHRWLTRPEIDSAGTDPATLPPPPRRRKALGRAA
jgi:hypothetical protein